MFPRPDVTRELARYVRVRLYTDGQGELYQRYQQMEQTMFGTVALPYYAVLRAGRHAGRRVRRTDARFGGVRELPQERPRVTAAATAPFCAS